MIRRLKDAIQGKAPIHKARSSSWPSVRRKHLAEHPTCEVCGGTEKLEVHHIKAFHLHPELELDPDNLITLCEAGTNGMVCHRTVGHLGSYQSYNVSVREDAAEWRKKFKERPT